MRAPPASSVGDVTVGLGDERLVEHPARDPRLVGHHDHGEAGAVQEAHGIDAVGKEHQPLEPIEIAGFLDERAVAIEKDGRASRCRGASSTDREHVVDGNPLHAPVIDRALAQHARTAEHVADDHVARPAASGAVTRSSVGPKIAVSGTPSAAAMCIAPESFDTNAAQRARTPTSCRERRAADQIDQRDAGRQ